MSRPILFLDVDGVLHPLQLEFKDGKLSDEHCFRSSCMLQLARIVKETNAEIVLSSSWRQFDGPKEKLVNALALYDLKYMRWTTLEDVDGSRASQILAFLDVHARQCKSWVILDDEDVTMGRDSLMMLVARQNFVHVDGEKALTEEDANRAIQILKQEEDC
ncbi:hypothetical protein CEUSTIGMA_g7402.t1 [Chlamydomonas eustigma]|uniref:FCP1 homology domain-containing protein n=1 Tax=Chlamydomonas eustigma TaxID=1157962 RepID=A0A250XA22_9CHLO|nr:hypothetical protein CEUSTIGMA_g7402.t1 [Chlamydomonas eustigma]|eukprot:GAX79963.1 hypothetical protein CEUSTIGMA_g7402.t1 [Chlamydomonas eustigma]